MVPSLSENIWVGFHHHVSISEMPSGSSYIPWHTIEINVVASWPLDKETGMIIDFSRLKWVIKTLLDKQFDHVTLLPPESEQLLNEFRKRGMRLVQTNGGSINGLPIVIFDTLVRANLGNSEVHLDNIRISNGAIWWHIKNNDGSPRISTLTKPENASIWTSDLHFSHRIPNIGKCDWLHGHNWSPKITFNRPLRKDEYMRITGKIKGKLEKLWGNKAILQSWDDFANFLKKIWKRVRKINSAPTTEMIAISMIREIEKILRQDGAGITLAHFELWETPTNFVTTI